MNRGLPLLPFGLGTSGWLIYSNILESIPGGIW